MPWICSRVELRNGRVNLNRLCRAVHHRCHYPAGGTTVHANTFSPCHGESLRSPRGDSRDNVSKKCGSQNTLHIVKTKTVAL